MSKSQNNLFPIFLKLEELSLLIIGGGHIALEKITAVLNNSPKTKVKLVAKVISPEIKTAAEHFSNVTLIEKEYSENDLEGIDLIIAAVGDVELSQKIKTDANKRGILINAADKPGLCDFYLGSIVQKGDLKIAISTNGKSPTVAKRIKETLQESFPIEINESLDNLTYLRKYLSGDFTEKVKQLNKITTVLKKEGIKKTVKVSKRRLWIYSIAMPILILVGYLLCMFLPPESLGGYAYELSQGIDASIFIYILAGFTAQMIDGALGMAYGITATTFLLSTGISPAISSASVHASEVFTSGVSGLMHLKFGNVNTKLFRHLLIPGVLGAILGAYILSSFQEYNDIIKPIVSIYTLVLGGIIILKAIKKDKVREKIKRIFPLALVGGFLDSIGGGGWGPIVSSTLIAGGRNARYTIGSVNLTEFFVSLASSVTFFTIIGLTQWYIIVGLITGGVIAAPIAAYFSSKIPSKAIMILVGVVVIILSLKRLFF